MALLTDALRERIGERVVYTAPEPLGQAAFRYFARAIDDRNPVYVDDQAARAAGFAGVVAPPTLVVETNAYADRRPDPMGSIGHRWDITIPGTREIRGGHRYRFGRPVRPADQLVVTWTLDDMIEKESRDGTSLVIITASQNVENVDGDHLATNIETTIFQELGGGKRG